MLEALAAVEAERLAGIHPAGAAGVRPARRVRSGRRRGSRRWPRRWPRADASRSSAASRASGPTSASPGARGPGVHLGEILRESVALLGGKGGGAPELAQGSGPDGGPAGRGARRSRGRAPGEADDDGHRPGRSPSLARFAPGPPAGLERGRGRCRGRPGRRPGGLGRRHDAPAGGRGWAAPAPARRGDPLRPVRGRAGQRRVHRPSWARSWSDSPPSPTGSSSCPSSGRPRRCAGPSASARSTEACSTFPAWLGIVHVFDPLLYQAGQGRGGAILALHVPLRGDHGLPRPLPAQGPPLGSRGSRFTQRDERGAPSAAVLAGGAEGEDERVALAARPPPCGAARRYPCRAPRGPRGARLGAGLEPVGHHVGGIRGAEGVQVEGPVDGEAVLHGRSEGEGHREGGRAQRRCRSRAPGWGSGRCGGWPSP